MKKHVVAAVVQKDNKFLLGKRSLSKKSAPGYWYPICGGIEKGEVEQDAVVREVFEEVGLIVTASRKVGQFDTHDGTALIHWWLVNLISGEPFKKNDEHSEIGWFTVDEMKNLDSIFPEDIAVFEKL